MGIYINIGYKNLSERFNCAEILNPEFPVPKTKMLIKKTVLNIKNGAFKKGLHSIYQCLIRFSIYRICSIKHW